VFVKAKTGFSGKESYLARLSCHKRQSHPAMWRKQKKLWTLMGQFGRIGKSKVWQRR
jgi:hypothetical protein